MKEYDVRIYEEHSFIIAMGNKVAAVNAVAAAAIVLEDVNLEIGVQYYADVVDRSTGIRAATLVFTG